jgi:type II secretory pathway pseudopilin PulG
MPHIHLPKVPHSWREFLKEYAIIVLGVLTALALEQAVESVHERRLAHEAQEAIHQEIQANIDRTAYRMSQQACIEKRLAEIEALLRDWQGDDAFPAGLHIGFPGDVGLVHERWEANLASGRFSEQSPEDQSQQAGLYSLIKILDNLQLQEIEHWSQLRALELGSRALSPAAKPMIATALANARSDARSVKLLAPILLNSQPTAARGTFTPAQPGSACEPMHMPG